MHGAPAPSGNFISDPKLQQAHLLTKLRKESKRAKRALVRAYSPCQCCPYCYIDTALFYRWNKPRWVVPKLHPYKCTMVLSKKHFLPATARLEVNICHTRMTKSKGAWCGWTDNSTHSNFHGSFHDDGLRIAAFIDGSFRNGDNTGSRPELKYLSNSLQEVQKKKKAQ